MEKSILSRDAVKTRQVYLLVAAGVRMGELQRGFFQVSTMESEGFLLCTMNQQR